MFFTLVAFLFYKIIYEARQLVVNLSVENLDVIINPVKDIITQLGQYFKAYSIVYSLTFIQTLIGFSVLGVKYTVILSIICAIADVLPVLGIGLIYLNFLVVFYKVLNAVKIFQV